MNPGAKTVFRLSGILQLAAILLLTLISLRPIPSSAQKVRFHSPDFKKISKAISKEGSVNYYPELMKRYRANDTTLTPYQYHLLYFGYIYTPEFQQLESKALSDSLPKLLRVTDGQQPDYLKIRDLCQQLLVKAPFDMRFIDPLIQASRMLGHQSMAAMLEFKLGRIVETIFSTGDGLSENTPFHVISTSHEADLMRALGFNNADIHLISSGPYDFYRVDAAKYGIEGIYFDISAAYLTRMK